MAGDAIAFLTGSYVLNHRALYLPGAKKTLAGGLMNSVNPIADPRTRTLGASLEISLNDKPVIAVTAIFLALSATVALAQNSVQPKNDPDLPEAPSAQMPQEQTGARQSLPDRDLRGKQTKRILYIIPNFRAVSANQKLPPQTIKDKFTTAALDSVDYSSFLFVAIQAGIAQARNATPEFHQGTAGYGRYYWHTYADYADENLWVEFFLPAALHQDSRYYTLGHGGLVKRLAYSFSRVAITRTDNGHETFNSSEIFGAGAAAGISGLYYPNQERTYTKTYQLWLTNVAIDGGTFIFKEFWPDINNRMFHQKY